MTSENLDRLRQMQSEIERAASTASTRAELMNLRSLWGTVQQVLDSEANRPVESTDGT
ncbi:hypothetical protein SEA_ZOOMAN_315 [Microbacterium phage Zooman]|nr:hypothetical protein SEA_ZOOMAN_2 [Microbacterium phage Zooman]UDL16556.1 hypothetical protein SEA_ZOOMAN_315 [Microbacterium phage Zooman]